MEKVKVTIMGNEVEGTVPDLAKLFKALNQPLPTSLNVNDDTKWHYSQTKDEYIYIPEMATSYLWNAFAKEYQTCTMKIFDSARTKKISLRDAMQAILNFPQESRSNEKHLVGLFTELLKRYNQGKI